MTNTSLFATALRWFPFDPVMTHMVGAALIAFGIGSVIAYLDPIKYVVIIRLEIMFTTLATITLLYSLLLSKAHTPTSVWMFAETTGMFALLFLILYPKE